MQHHGRVRCGLQASSMQRSSQKKNEAHLQIRRGSIDIVQVVPAIDGIGMRSNEVNHRAGGTQHLRSGEVLRLNLAGAAAASSKADK